eukprot:2702707-Rhodomonas_salina.2
MSVPTTRYPVGVSAYCAGSVPGISYHVQQESTRHRVLSAYPDRGTHRPTNAVSYVGHLIRRA